MGTDLNSAREVEAMLGLMPFASALGVKVVSVSEGSVTVEAPLSPPLEAPAGAFAASSVGVIGDIAVMMSLLSAAPKGVALSTMDFTIKMLDISAGDTLRATGKALQLGKATGTGSAEVQVIRDGKARICGSVLATGRVLDLGKLVKT